MRTNFKSSIRTYIILLVIAATALFIIFKTGIFATENDTIYIAVVGPMTGPDQTDGQDMVRGIKLYLDKVNDMGGINGKPIELLEYDDQDKEVLARQRALEIVTGDKAPLVVLGHNFSSTSLAGGKVYQEYGMPAISGSATAEDVTQDNDWYFRVIFNNQSQASFLANYLNRIMEQEAVSIIYNQDSYGTSLMEAFEDPFIGLGGNIKYKWGFDSESPNLDQELAKIVTDLLKAKADDPGMIFLAMHQNEATKLIVSMKRKGLDYPIIGAEALGDTRFATRFNKYPEEKITPGYFSDGLYATSPILFDVAGEKVLQFRRDFIKKYKLEPRWTAATYYDAAIVAVEAIKKSEAQGKPENLAEERAKIRDYLGSLKDSEHAIEGRTGPIYFNKYGDAIKPVSIGVFNKQHFISALTQLQPVGDLNRVADLEKELAAGRILIVDGRYMYKTRIVYTGLDFNEVSNFNANSSSYTLDFYLWFRYQGDIDMQDIELINATGAVALGQPVAKATLDNDVIYEAYRVKTNFTENFDFHDYPFDKQKPAIHFRHGNLTHENLIFVVDLVGMSETVQDNILEKFKRAQGDVSGWQVETVDFFQDLLISETTLGNPQFFGLDSDIEYSRFNGIITVKRDVSSFVIKNLLPVFFIIILAYLSFYLPTNQLTTRNGLLSGSILSIAFFHLKLSNELPGIGYTVALDYAFYVLYGLIVFGLIITLLFWHREGLNEALVEKNKELLRNQGNIYDRLKASDKEDQKPTEEQIQIEANNLKIKRNKQFEQILTLLGRIVFPVVIIGLFLSFGYWYNLSPLSFKQNTAITENLTSPNQPLPTQTVQTQPTQEEVILTIGSWRTDDIQQINKIIATFNAKYPHITIKFEPAVDTAYGHVLATQLEHNIGPDMFYMFYGAHGRSLYEAGYLELLGDLPGLRENFSPEARDPWTTEQGQPYGLPLWAVSYGIYYNVDLFKGLGLEIPTTWEQLLATAQVIKDAGYIPFANESKGKTAIGGKIFWTVVPNTVGGREGREEYMSGRRCFNDEQIVKAYQAIADIAPFLPENRETLSYYDSQQLFLQGQAAMLIDGSWTVSSFEAESPDFEWSIFAVPAPTGQPTYITFQPDAALGLNAASKHKEEAKLFLEWLTTSEAAELFGNELPGMFPLHKDAPALKNKHAYVFSSLNKEYGTDWRWDFAAEGLPRGKDLLFEGAAAVVRGQMSPQEAADHAQNGLAQWYEPAQRCRQQLRVEN